MADSWKINDSYPLFFGMESEPPLPEWPQGWYGPPVMMLMTEEVSGPPHPPSSDRRVHGKILTFGFFGPKRRKNV